MKAVGAHGGRRGDRGPGDGRTRSYGRSIIELHPLARRAPQRSLFLVDGPEQTSAARLIPRTPTLATLRAAAASCRACPLWERATQTVFGEGCAPARALLVGEQPGDRE